MKVLAIIICIILALTMVTGAVSILSSGFTNLEVSTWMDRFAASDEPVVTEDPLLNLEEEPIDVEEEILTLEERNLLIEIPKDTNLLDSPISSFTWINVPGTYHYKAIVSDIKKDIKLSYSLAGESPIYYRINYSCDGIDGTIVGVFTEYYFSTLQYGQFSEKVILPYDTSISFEYYFHLYFWNEDLHIVFDRDPMPIINPNDGRFIITSICEVEINE